MKDKLKDHTLKSLKCKYVIEEAFRDAKWNVDIEFGNPTNARVDIREFKHSYRGHSWTYKQEVLTVTIPETWYDNVYLNGIGTVRYNNSLTIALTAVEEEISKLHPKYQTPGVKLFKVKMPIISFKWLKNYEYRYDVSLEERYMVQADLTDSSLCYAGLSPNRAAASLHKNMMTVMKEKMSI